MERITPKKMAARVVKLLRNQRPGANYVKKVFEYVREELGIRGGSSTQKALPVLLSEEELTRFYETVWNAADRTHMVMIKLLMFTGIRNIELDDVDIKGLRIKIRKEKGGKERYVLFPASFRGELAQYMENQKSRHARYLFETHCMDKYTTRWIREIVKRYALTAGIKKRIYPHLFRHQLLTHLAKEGLIDSKVQVISGHQDRDSLAIYQTLSLVDVKQEYQEAMKRFPII